MMKVILKDKEYVFPKLKNIPNIRRLMNVNKVYQDSNNIIFGSNAIWLPEGDIGKKIVFQKVDIAAINAIANGCSDIFPNISWFDLGVLTDGKNTQDCVLMEMENVVGKSKPNYDKCINEFERLKLAPEDTWNKKGNIINGKIVDFHGFKYLPERYEFPYSGDVNELQQLYLNGPRWHTQKKDKGLTDKDTLYQGFRFKGLTLTGYSSDKSRFDSYRKLAFMLLSKSEGGKALDLGSCQGFFSFQAALHGIKEITAVEHSEKHHNFAQQLNKLVFNYNNIKFVHGDAAKYVADYDGGKFDVVFLMSVLHQIYPHMKGSDKFLANIAAKTKRMSYETPVNHPKMRINKSQIEKNLKKHFRDVRELYEYKAYSPGKRVIYSCYV